MSLEDSPQKHVYDCDETTSVWPFTFDVTAAGDVAVYKKIGTAIPEKVLSGYTVDVNAGEVTYAASAAFTADDQVILVREVPASQGFIGGTTGTNNPKTYEAAFDRLTMLVQDLQEKVVRAVKFPLDQTPDQDDTDAFLQQLQDLLDAGEAARDAAQTAQAAAEAAQSAAEAAQAAAESAKDDAETALAAIEAQQQSGLYSAKPASPATRVEYYSTDRDSLEVWIPTAGRWFLQG